MHKSTTMRAGRYSEAGRIYLLTCVVKNRQPLFNDFAVGRLLVAELRSAHEGGWIESLAWVVMPDHLHWMVALKTCTVATLMRRIKGRSARAINAALGKTGGIWQDGYHDRAVRREEDLPAIARYIVANPLRAGLVGRVGDYPLWDADRG